MCPSSSGGRDTPLPRRGSSSSSCLPFGGVISIRVATPADATSITDIVNSLLSSTTIEWRHERYSADTMLEWMAVDDCVLVAEHEGEWWVWLHLAHFVTSPSGPDIGSRSRTRF